MRLCSLPADATVRLGFLRLVYYGRTLGSLGGEKRDGEDGARGDG